MDLDRGGRVEPAQGSGRGLDLRRLLLSEIGTGGGGARSCVVVRVQDLPVEVADVDAVPVAQPELPHPGRCQVEGRGAAETAQANDKGGGRGEAGLGWRGKKRGGREGLREKGKKDGKKKRMENQFYLLPSGPNHGSSIWRQ